MLSHANPLQSMPTECAIVGAKDEMKGTVPVALLVVPPGADASDAEISQEVIAMIRETVGAVASVKSAAVVKALPKTRSGKILRGVMKKIADGEEYVLPGRCWRSWGN